MDLVLNAHNLLNISSYYVHQTLLNSYRAWHESRLSRNLFLRKLLPFEYTLDKILVLINTIPFFSNLSMKLFIRPLDLLVEP